MYRALTLAVLVLAIPAPRGERIEAIYREGATLVLEKVDSLAIEVDVISMSINVAKLPRELRELVIAAPTRREDSILRLEDRVLALSEGRPTCVRRTFERVRRTSVAHREETEEIGPLEGRTLVLEEEDGEVRAELEDGGDEVDELYLEDHRLTGDADAFLPDREVSVGDTWPLDEGDLRELVGFGSGPVLFEDEEEKEEDEEDEEDLFDELFEEARSTSADVELLAIEERDGLRCAVLAFTVELASELADPEAFGVAPEDRPEEVSALLAAEIRMEGRLWYALAEGRPVAMERSLESTLEFRLHMKLGRGVVLEDEMTCSLAGEAKVSWSVPE